MSEPMKVFLVDDHELVRAGLRSLVDAQPDMSVVGEAEEATAALTGIARTSPDVAVLDVRLPGMNGVDLCRRVKRERPSVNVLMLTSFADEDTLVSAIEAGASGFLLKHAHGNELVSSIRGVGEGCDYLRSHGPHLPDGFDDDRRTGSLSLLSGQESAVAHHIARGATNREIAREMGLAEKTVKNYVSNLLAKLGMQHRAEVAALVARHEASEGREEIAESWEEVGFDAICV